MTNKELVLNMLAEISTKEISESTNPTTFDEHKSVAKRGGKVARNARLLLEEETNKPVVSPMNAKHFIENTTTESIMDISDKNPE